MLPVEVEEEKRPGSVREVQDVGETRGKQRPVIPEDVLVCTM